jgi:hypothetical protein
MLKFSVLLLILSFNLFAQEGEWDLNALWPTKLTESTQYYRGQRTDLASFDHIIDMLMNPKSEKVITSRMYRTFQKVFPTLNTFELIKYSNQQYEYWKKEQMLWWIADCHADPYMCTLPKIKKLMGVVFKEKHLPEGILNQLQGENDSNYVVSSQLSKGEILSFFDPVVSTSYFLEIAKSFAHDKNGYDGYVLILNDKLNRNCTSENKKTADCFIHNEEFMEELEFPMWGYATSNELDGVIIDHITITKRGSQTITLKNNIDNSSITLGLKNLNNCKLLNELVVSNNKVKRMQKSLLKYFKCL